MSLAGYEGVCTVPDPLTGVLNLLLRCYSNLLGPPQPGLGGGGETEKEKSVGYPERALSLIRDMESIGDQAKSEDIAAAANSKGGGGVELRRRLGWERWK